MVVFQGTRMYRKHNGSAPSGRGSSMTDYTTKSTTQQAETAGGRDHRRRTRTGRITTEQIFNLS